LSAPNAVLILKNRFCFSLVLIASLQHPSDFSKMCTDGDTFLKRNLKLFLCVILKGFSANEVFRPLLREHFPWLFPTSYDSLWLSVIVSKLIQSMTFFKTTKKGLWKITENPPSFDQLMVYHKAVLWDRLYSKNNIHTICHLLKYS
jgi:hypothetical protein